MSQRKGVWTTHNQAVDKKAETPKPTKGTDGLGFHSYFKGLW